MPLFTCPGCGRAYDLQENVWECSCGSCLDMTHPGRLDPARIDQGERSLWRYAHALPAEHDEQRVSLGEGWTPLMPLERGNERLMVKMEFTNPTGSYKDRGMSLMVSNLVEAGIREVVEDSSGNAGASLAAYTARAGIRCRIFAPATHSSGKMRQIQAYGAELVPVAGTRKDTSDAAHQAARTCHYASHAHSPLFIEGVKTMAYELWEQLGGEAPETVISPLGQGSILLALYQGFRQLVDDGYAAAVPALVGVQAEACAPLALAFDAGEERPRRVPQPGHTAAEGIKLAEPVRGERVLQALRATGGRALAVSEAEILAAQDKLARSGFYVEPTSAVTLAGYRKLPAQPAGRCVLILTGSGLKTQS